jgi:hypothetical protein
MRCDDVDVPPKPDHAVVASNIHWHWTPNGNLASASVSLQGFLAALTPSAAVTSDSESLTALNLSPVVEVQDACNVRCTTFSYGSVNYRMRLEGLLLR